MREVARDAVRQGTELFQEPAHMDAPFLQARPISKNTCSVPLVLLRVKVKVLAPASLSHWQSGDTLILTEGPLRGPTEPEPCGVMVAGREAAT